MDSELYLDTYDAFCVLIKDNNAEILDVACGPGNFARYVLSSHPNFKLHGFDLSPGMIGLTRTNNPSATFEVMDAK
jgi:trans-aconitate methyltransferase